MRLACWASQVLVTKPDDSSTPQPCRRGFDADVASGQPDGLITWQVA